MRSSVFASAIRRVLDTAAANRFTPVLTITSETNTSYTFTPMMVTSWSLSQKPSAQYLDDITISFKISPADYLGLYDNAQGLLASVRMSFVDRDGKKVYNPPPKTRQYRAILVNPQDIRHRLKDANLHTTPQMEVSVRLLEKKAYDLRLPKFSGMFKANTVEDVIRYIAAKGFEIEKLVLAPPDNTHKYDHIVVPPTKGFDEVFDYLQATYGVYMKGVESYFTNDTLYIYPPYDKAQTVTDSITLYDAPGHEYAGLPGYHSNNSGALEIVATGESQSRDLSQIGAENNGTSVMFMRSSQLVDGGATTTAKGTEFADDAAATIRMASNKTASGKASNAQYAGQTDNPFAVSSAMAKFDTTLVRTAWVQATPYLVRPGQAVRYVTDKDGRMITSDALLEEISYQTVRGDNGPDGMPLFTCAATLQLRVASKEKSS